MTPKTLPQKKRRKIAPFWMSFTLQTVSEVIHRCRCCKRCCNVADPVKTVLQQICKIATNMQQICNKYATLQRICNKYATNMQQICNKYATNMQQFGENLQIVVSADVSRIYFYFNETVDLNQRIETIDLDGCCVYCWNKIY
jgi:hypothetical protein